METVEVVIRIPKVIYDKLSHKKMLDEFVKSEVHFYDFEIGKSIQNGTILPKGHGSLKDYDGIKSDYFRKMSVTMSTEFRMKLLCGVIDNAPAVIEADKEVDNTRDCKNCKHYKKYEGIYGCESWECSFERKDDGGAETL